MEKNYGELTAICRGMLPFGGSNGISVRSPDILNYQLVELRKNGEPVIDCIDAMTPGCIEDSPRSYQKDKETGDPSWIYSRYDFALYFKSKACKKMVCDYWLDYVYYIKYEGDQWYILSGFGVEDLEGELP